MVRRRCVSKHSGGKEKPFALAALLGGHDPCVFTLPRASFHVSALMPLDQGENACEREGAQREKSSEAMGD